jgi:hypothetical protein
MVQQAAAVAFNEQAPEAERTQALGELQKAHMPTASDLMPNETVRQIMTLAEAQFEDDLLKNISSNVVPFPSRNNKADKPGMKSVFLDEWQINVNGDWWDRPGGIPFDGLRMMVAQTPVLNAVIMTRQRQVQRFCRVAEKGNDMPGFEIRHIDRGHQLTNAESKSIALLNRFISNCGWEFTPRKRKMLHRDSFAQFMSKSVRDSLVMDSAPIELEWKNNKAKGLDGFYAVDGATIRLCTEDGYDGDDAIFALQVVEGMITTAYTHDDLIYENRNPRTDVTAAGYGISETELLIRVVTGYINAMSYNIKGFDSNSIPKGMLHLSGQYDDGDIKAFRRYWNAMVKGVQNAWNLPIMVSKDQESKATFEKFGVEFNEMYFSKWMTFLTSLICAIYGMSPSEINFDSFSGGNTSPLSGSDTGEKLAASKDSGLRPLLASYENVLTDFLVQEFSPNFCFRFTGLDPEDRAVKNEMRKLVLTVNEIRAEEGHEAMEGPLGDAPVNSALLTPWMAINGVGQEHDDPDGGEGGGASGGASGGDPTPKPGSGADAAETDDGVPGDDMDFGNSDQPTDFGKAFGLPPVFNFEELMD